MNTNTQALFFFFQRKVEKGRQIDRQVDKKTNTDKYKWVKQIYSTHLIQEIYS